MAPSTAGPDTQGSPGSVSSYAAPYTKAISKKIYKRRETILARILQSDSVVHSARYMKLRLYSAGRNPQMLVVMDAENGKVIQSFPISAGVDAAIYEPEAGLVFCSTREGMIHIFHEDTPDKFSVIETVKTEYGAKTMALDPKTHNLYLTTSDFGPPPAPTPERPNPNPAATPGTFRLLIYGR